MSEELEIGVGFHTDPGGRASNGDFGAAFLGTTAQRARQGVTLALADGVAGGKGDRVAAETAVRSFIDGYYSQPDTIGAQRAAARSMAAVNRWIFAQGKTDPDLTGMACTLTALILRGRQAHITHVGDTRLYRLRAGEIERLTTDHAMSNPDMRHILLRAVGAEESIRVDYAVDAIRVHDRFLICTDGVHGSLRDREIRASLMTHGSAEDAARALVDAALTAGSTDNTSALIADVIALPKANHAELQESVASLPILDPPVAGTEVDGFRLDTVLGDGRYSRIFDAFDQVHNRRVVIKFPKPGGAPEQTLRLGMVREIWVPARIRSEWVGEVIEQAQEQQTRLYLVMPYYQGETLEQRIKRKPHVSLSEGVQIAIKLAKAMAALHRAHIIHRDIKPDNVILQTNGGLKLIDLGVVSIPNFEDFPAEDIPGTPSYMAPELFQGQQSDEKSDQFALGVAIYRIFSGGAFPYGEVEPFSHPRFGAPTSLLRYRPELPVWLDAVVAKAIAVDPDSRFSDAIELAFELEKSLGRGQPSFSLRRRPLYERNPVLVWQGISLILFVLLVTLLAMK